MFALDSTGEGGGLASIFQREWSPEILCVEFGGRPSKHPVSQTNPKRADQEYDRRVTELWFAFQITCPERASPRIGRCDRHRILQTLVRNERAIHFD